MAIAVVEWDHTLDTTPGASSQATGSHTYTADRLYVCFVTQMRVDSTAPSVPTVAGFSATWTDISGSSSYWDQSTPSLRRTNVFKAVPSGSGSGAVTVSYASTPGDIDIVVLEVDGGADVAQVVDWTGSWTASALNEHLTMSTPASTSRFLSYVACNVALVTGYGATATRMELSTDSGGDADWTTFSYEETTSSPTASYISGYYDADPSGDLTPGWYQNSSTPAAAYMVAVEVTAVTASPTAALPGWGIIAAQGTPVTAPSGLLIGATVDNGPNGGGPVGESDAAATARFNNYLTVALGRPVDIQIGRRYTGSNPSNFSSVAEFAQDINTRHRIVSIKGSTVTQPTQAQITTFLNSIPQDGYHTHMLVHHEPENDGGTHTTSWFQTMLNNLHGAWSDVGRDDITPGLCLMSWFERDSDGGTSSADWFPDSGIIADFVLWLDPYDQSATTAVTNYSGPLEHLVEDTLALWVAAGGSLAGHWGIAETGSLKTGSNLATWIHESVAYCRATGAVAWCFFHSTVGTGELLNDAAGRLAMAQELEAAGGGV